MNDGLIIKEKIKLVGMRKIIGDKMRESVTQYPQGTLFNKMNMEPILQHKNQLKKEHPEITVTGLLIKAVSNTLKEYPEFNSAIIEDELIIYESINIGVIAEAQNGGLYILVIKNTETKNVIEISQELKTLLNKLNAGKITMDDLSGATFTLSNLGMFDLDFFTPLLMPPQTGILGISGTRKEIVVKDDDTTVIQRRACFSLTGNHAASDGAPAARLLGTLRTYIEKPENL